MLVQKPAALTLCVRSSGCRARLMSTRTPRTAFVARERAPVSTPLAVGARHPDRRSRRWRSTRCSTGARAPGGGRTVDSRAARSRRIGRVLLPPALRRRDRRPDRRAAARRDPRRRRRAAVDAVALSALHRPSTQRGGVLRTRAPPPARDGLFRRSRRACRSWSRPSCRRLPRRDPGRHPGLGDRTDAGGLDASPPAATSSTRRAVIVAAPAHVASTPAAPVDDRASRRCVRPSPTSRP